LLDVIESITVSKSRQVHRLLICICIRRWRVAAKCPHNARSATPPNANDETQIPAWKLSVSSEGEDVPTDSRAGTMSDSDEMPAIIVRQEFECPGDLASVAESRERVVQFVCQHCPDEVEQIDILVALQEALANATLHGCGDDAAKAIHCAVEVSPSDITITVRDPGAGFDFALADPDNFASSTQSNGRGICLMRSLMTEVSFAHGGSELIMRKHFEKCH
jgi:anti-sigma regulatory factor (Ser/Thr protein kinase)